MTLVLAALLFALALAGVRPEAAGAHRDPCHSKHKCPSDHATYKWKGWRCVKPTSTKRNSTFRKRITYGGKVYFCKR
jgi:hypothetical protein